MSSQAPTRAHSKFSVRDATLLATRLVRKQKAATAGFEKTLAKGLARLRREKDREIAKLRKKKKKTVEKLRSKIVRMKAVPKKALSPKMSTEKAYEIVFGGHTTKGERAVALAAVAKRRQERSFTKKPVRIPVFDEDLDRVKSQVAEINGASSSDSGAE